jgi:hypothetical protein
LQKCFLLRGAAVLNDVSDRLADEWFLLEEVGEPGEDRVFQLGCGEPFSVAGC